MIVTYLGDKENMVSYGYDFSNGPVDVPETDEFSTRKYLGNMYFHCDHVDNYAGPEKSVEAMEDDAHKIAEAIEQNIPKEISIGVFKKQKDGTPYSRPQKVFTGTDEAELKDKASEWMEEKEINPDDRLIMVK